MNEHGLAVVRGRLQAELARLVEPIKTNADNERLAAHLEAHLEDFFTFLRFPGLDATNWRAEQAIRPAVVNRKVWGGNRTARGARVQSVLMSVLSTCYQRSHDAIAILMDTLCAPSTRFVPAEGR
ncbi:MAG: transposase [Planctomycetes bacterium]|nr:transposase [Planctomycetota bacterium]